MLSSKLAIITGAGSGIGRAACFAFAREGATVVAADRNIKSAQDVIHNLGDKNHSAFALDVSSSAEVNNVMAQVLERYARPPAILVNSAGITLDNFIVNMSEESFDKVLAVNLKGTFLMLQSCAKLLSEKNQPGSIINISSIIGKIGNLGQCNYAASKAGVQLTTVTAAHEFGKFGIRVNCILPGFIATPMVETVPEKVKDMFKKKIGLKRLGEPEEVAEVIVFLASDKSSYVNGASIEVTGGF